MIDHPDHSLPFNTDDVMMVIDNVINDLGCVNEDAEELKVLDSELAQEVAEVLYRGLDSIKHNLGDIFEKHQLNNLLNTLNNKVYAAL